MTAHTTQLQLPPKLIQVFAGEAMYRGAYGGRGSAKTRSFATMAAVAGYRLSQEGKRGIVACGREFMNSLADSSFSEVKLSIETLPWLRPFFDLGEKYIRTADGRIDFAFVGLRHSLDSIKSMARLWLLWVDEAEPVSEMAWIKADNTVRELGAETWVTWNPERRGSATDVRFRQSPPPESNIVQLNWRDNPWFPTTLEKKRLADKLIRPDQYEHIWEGDYVTVVEGAYFSKELAAAQSEGRIGNLGRDPHLIVRLFADIGGTGARADAFVFWAVQFIGREIRVLNHYEVQGQPIGAHLAWLRENHYEPKSAKIWLPHDGDTKEKIIDWNFRSAFAEQGYDVEVVPNQGRGAARMRIEAVKRIFPSIWFNAAPTKAGREALGWYHEKRRDDDPRVGLGPDHDWASHSADAFGLMAVVYEPETKPREADKGYRGAHGWLG